MDRLVKIDIRKTAIHALNVGSFLGIVIFVRFFIIESLIELYYIVLFYYTSDGAGTSPMFVMALLYYSTAARLGFYISIVILLIKPARIVFKLVRQYTYPPYHSSNISNQPSLVSQTRFQKGEWYSLKLSLGIFVISFIYIVLIVQYGFIQAPRYAGNMYHSIDDNVPSYIFIIVSQLFSIPFGQIEQQLIGDMGQYSIMSNLVFLWMPAGILVIGFLNFMDFLYNRFRRFLYQSLIPWSP